MAVEITVPDLGTNVDEVKLVSWLVEEGGRVERGAPIAAIETDKAVTELESYAEGVLLKQVVSEGQTAATGDVLAYVGEEGEKVPEAAAETGPAQAAATPKPARRAAAPRGVSPVVRNLAEKHRVDLERVEGTGPRGSVTRQDVIQAAREGAARTEEAAGRELPAAQAAVARAVSRSASEIPHLRLKATVDMMAADRTRERHRQQGAGVGYDAMFVKALAAALLKVPDLAAHLENGRMVRPDGIHIAVAIDRGNGLFLPVVRDADAMTVLEVHRAIEGFAERAHSGTIRPQEMVGGCIALSNLGMYPIDLLEAIIWPEHSAILGVGSVRSRPVVVQEKVEVRPTVQVSLAADHRLINGRTAAEFLTVVKRTLETAETA